MTKIYCEKCKRECDKKNSHFVTQKIGRKQKRIRKYFHFKCWDEQTEEFRAEWKRRGENERSE